jgi:K+-transporting ATPase ATPase B chain
MTAIASPPASPRTPQRDSKSLFASDILGPSLWGAVKKLDPRVQVRNPVMFVVEVGAVISTVAWFLGGSDPG